MQESVLHEQVLRRIDRAGAAVWGAPEGWLSGALNRTAALLRRAVHLSWRRPARIRVASVSEEWLHRHEQESAKHVDGA